MDYIIDSEEVEENLKKVAEALAGKATQNPLEKTCLTIVRDAKLKCPTDDGTLRNSIQYEISNDDEGNLTGYVGSNIEYAPYVHEGTGIYAKDGNGRKEVPWVFKDSEGNFHRTSGIKSTPFLQDAVEQNKEIIIQYFLDVMKELGEVL